MKLIKNKKTAQRARRHKRIRSKVAGTESRPRLSVFKSNKYIVLQLINDEKGTTFGYISTKNVKGKNLLEKAFDAGKEIAKIAGEKKISEAVFDRGGYIYTGAIQKAAEGAREGGLKF